jgi:DNA-binding CsgD family transcriptional regulator
MSAFPTMSGLRTSTGRASAYGTWLRRRRRSGESRAPLREARDALDRLRLDSWGKRAREELPASGETSRPRRPEAWDQLSPQELRIARLAAEGLTNRAIGQRLYLSHRTVGSHLYRMFPKLGITTRAQLALVLPAVTDEPTRSS